MGNCNKKQQPPPPEYPTRVSLSTLREVKRRQEKLEEEKKIKHKNYLATIFRSIILERLNQEFLKMKSSQKIVYISLKDIRGYSWTKEQIESHNMKPFYLISLVSYLPPVKMTPLEIFVYGRVDTNDEIDYMVERWNDEFGGKMRITNINWEDLEKFITIQILDDSFEVEI